MCIPKKNVFFSLAATLSLAAGALVVSTSGASADDCTLQGQGQGDRPYQIRTAADLDLLAGANPACDLDKDYLVLDDITVGADWAGIGVGAGSFSGLFDGGYHTISIGSDDNPTDIGLFGAVVNEALVVNTNVEISFFATYSTDEPGGYHVGGLAGFANDAAFINTSVSGSIFVDARADAGVLGIGLVVGGLIGQMMDSLVDQSTANMSIYVDSTGGQETQAVGGLVGWMDGDANGDVLIGDSYSSGDITVTHEEVNVGGLVGFVDVEAGRTGDIGIGNTYTVTELEPADGTTSTGGFIGKLDDPDGLLELEANFWSSDASGVDDGITVFAPTSVPTTGLTDLEFDEIADFSTFDDAGWDIADGWAPYFSLTDPDFIPQLTWGICPGVNFGTPYLLWQYPSDPCTYVPLVPQRFMDTRPGTPEPANPEAHATGPIAAGETYELEITGFGDVPFDADSVAINLTVVEADADGFATVWPCGEDRPEASSLNFVGVGTIANTVISALDIEGKLCIYLGQGAANVLVDVNGYFPLGSDYVGLTPERFMDTRPGSPVPVNPDAHATGPLEPGEAFELEIAGLGDVPAGAAAVVLNVAAIDAQGQGFLSVWPCGETRPEDTSNLNFVGVSSIANATIATIGDDGAVCLATEQVAAEVLVDVSGYFPADSGYHGVVPTRVFDSRREADGAEKIEPGEQFVISPVMNDSGVPLEAQAAMLNITIVEADGAGFATVWPCGEPQPETSNVNFVGVSTIANGAITKVGNDGEPGAICIVLGQVAAHVLVDVNGYFE